MVVTVWAATGVGSRRVSTPLGEGHGASGAQRYRLDDFQPVGFDAGDLSRVIAQQANALQAQVPQNLCSEPELPQRRPGADAHVLGLESSAAAHGGLLAGEGEQLSLKVVLGGQVDDDSVALPFDVVERATQMATPLARLRSEH